MPVQICLGILVAFMLGLPYASEEVFSVTVLGRSIGWWRVMLAAAVLPALLQVTTFMQWCKMRRKWPHVNLCAWLDTWRRSADLTFVTFDMQVACLITVSESPTWLRLSGRFDEAHLAECMLLSGDDLDVALLIDDADEPHLPQPQARFTPSLRC